MCTMSISCIAMVTCLAIGPRDTALAQAVTPSPSTSSETVPVETSTGPSKTLEACAKKYATATSYQDEGVVMIEYASPKSEQAIQETQLFHTTFERAGGLLWQCKAEKPPSSYTLRSKDQKAFESSWTPAGRTASFNDLQSAMKAATGVSGAASHLIIPLLRPDVMHGQLSRIETPIDKGKEVVEGVECTKIEGKIEQKSASGSVTVWIDADLAIRKIRLEARIDSANLPGGEARAGGDLKFVLIMTTTVRPRFDEVIPNHRFHETK